MIRSIRHKGLRRLFERGDPSRVDAQQSGRIRRILSRLQSAAEVQDMNLPGFVLHPLTGDLRGFWAVRV